MIKIIKNILGYKNFKKLKAFIFFNILIFFLETLSILSIPFFVSYLIDSDKALEKFKNIFFFEIDNNFFSLQSILIFIILIFYLKNFFLLTLNYLQGKFIEKVKIETSVYLYNHYLNMPYLKHIEKNPSALSRNIIFSTERINLLITSLISLIREAVTVLVILFLFSWLSPIASLILIIFFTALINIYFLVTKPKLKQKSSFNNNLRKKLTQLIFETFNCIKEIKISMKEKFISNYFEKNIIELEKNIFFFNFNEKLPKIILELLSITFIVIASLIFISFSKDFLVFLPEISLIVVCIFRFIPAFNGIAVSSTYIKISTPDLKNLENEINEIEIIKKNTTENLTKSINYKPFNDKFKNNYLIVEDLSFKYDEKSTSVLNINFKADKGKIIGITGDSGVGKSTFFNILIGLFNPKKGNVFLYGVNILEDPIKWKKRISHVSQNTLVLDGSIIKNVTFNYTDSEVINNEELTKALKVSEFYSKITSFEKGLNTELGYTGAKLSGGEKQRLALSRALYKNPEILFLDESTNALDAKSEKRIVNNIRENYSGITIIIISHRNSTLSLCDQVIKLSNDKLY